LEFAPGDARRFVGYNVGAMTTQQKMLLALIPAAYLVGSIPFGLLVGLARGIDVRTAGSGNIGATNVGRLLGGKFFALVFVLDVLKGLLPMLAAGFVLGFHAEDRTGYLLWLLVGFAAILGHMFSVFLKFKGGKGVATSTGVMLGLWPYYTLPGIAGATVWGVAFKASRIVSLASVAGAVAFPIAYVVIGLLLGWPIFGEQLPLLVFAFLVGGLIVFRHRSNLARLRAGTEHRFTTKAAARPMGNGDGTHVVAREGAADDSDLGDTGPGSRR
jgi:glycerol-3-phosphate acyltransferase PlsY